jgi:hypothetical protein
LDDPDMGDLNRIVQRIAWHGEMGHPSSLDLLAREWELLRNAMSTYALITMLARRGMYQVDLRELRSEACHLRWTHQLRTNQSRYTQLSEADEDRERTP